MSKVLVITTSLRKISNSELLADEFIKGAKDAGHDVEKISLRGRKLGYCIGCLSCQKTGKCVIKDDMTEINQKLHDCDAVAFATPIYYYEMCGQMKTLLDRANPLYGSDYRFRKVYLLSTAAENDENTADRAIEGLCGWVECFEKAEFAGTVFSGGVNKPGEVRTSPSLKEAYKLGSEIE